MDHPREYGENLRQVFHHQRVDGSSPRIRGKCRHVEAGRLDVGIIPANTGKIQSHERKLKRKPDHPREYGENVRASTWIWPKTGSSPRIRGKYRLPPLMEAGLGIIPANTGKIAQDWRWFPLGWDHPREYGENLCCNATMPSASGSSPRIRGKYLEYALGYTPEGIIPANTGKIRTTRSQHGGRGDHPREYGENLTKKPQALQTIGSSPRIRGKLDRAKTCFDQGGIIPANTGKIYSPCRGVQAKGDHPREYGENHVRVVDAGILGGSSPRIRGKYDFRDTAYAIEGIIPANTGKITMRLRVPCVRRDHPREYGENGGGKKQVFTRGGSSPRIRGKFISYSLLTTLSGIIPANTGKIPSTAAPPPCLPDHPREYGENRTSCMRASTWTGSSPRIRGKFSAFGEGELVGGIIPANTGKMELGVEWSGFSRDHPREYGENSVSNLPPRFAMGSSPRIRGKYLLTCESPTSKTDFTSLSFSASSSTHAGGFGPSSFHGSSSRGDWMPHQCESFHVGGFPLATVHSHNKTLLVFVCWVCHNRAP